MYELAMQMLEKAEYRHYEISNWAKKSSKDGDFRCRHNLQYWRNQEYYGFGAGAHGYIRNMRVVNYSEIPQYITHASNSNDIFATYKETNETELNERMQDELMLGLRLVDEGVSAKNFKSKFGFEMTEVFSDEISRLIRQHLIKWSDGEGSSIILTERGNLLGNQVFMEFVGD
jgi:oxygen-independent coproporphyrinogen-3 oxidase